MILSISTSATDAAAQTIENLKPEFERRMDAIADKLEEGEICRRDLRDCKAQAVDAENDMDCGTGSHLALGFLAGSLATFVIITLTHREK